MARLSLRRMKASLTTFSQLSIRKWAWPLSALQLFLSAKPSRKKATMFRCFATSTNSRSSGLETWIISYHHYSCCWGKHSCLHAPTFLCDVAPGTEMLFVSLLQKNNPRYLKHQICAAPAPLSHHKGKILFDYKLTGCAVILKKCSFLQHDSKNVVLNLVSHY